MTIVEALVVGLLFHKFAVMRYIDILQWWGAASMLGLYATAVVYPHVVTPTEVRLRHRGRVISLPLAQVQRVRWNPMRQRPVEDSSLFLPAKEGTQLTFELEPPVMIDGRTVFTVHAAADDQAVVERIQGCIATSRTSS